MTLRRRAMLALAAAALPGRLAAQPAWPGRPVRIIVPFPPGGSNDAVARPLAEVLQRRLGQPFVIDNRPGAGSTIGSAEVARAPADGHVLMVTSTTFATSAAVQRTPYDAARDFECVAVLATAPMLVLAAPGFPPNTLAETVSYIRANPDRVDYASAGPGSINQLAAELFAREAGGLRMQHVPYRGMGPATTDLVAGTIQLLFTTMPSAAGVIAGGRVKVLGWTAEQRPANGPAAPTPGESGLPGYEAGIWWGLLSRRGLPPAVRDLINAMANEALADPRLAGYLASEGALPGRGSAAEADRFLQVDLARWREVAAAANIRVE
jgi:tripartite-type tricarboxylate transporter receptor subunit TctC